MPLIRILSWNILQGGGRRQKTILDSVASHHPDIFAIQEYRNPAGTRPLIDELDEQGLPYFHAPATTSSSVNCPAIASRWPFDVIDVFPPPSDDSQPHCLHVRFDTPDAKLDLDVIAVHLPHKKAQLPVFDYLNSLPSHLRDAPTILIGDFNCGIPLKDSETKTFENTERFQQLLRDGWIDAWRKRHPQEREFTWISPKKQHGYRYDHALVSPSLDGMIETVAYDHGARKSGASDHSAIYLDVRVVEQAH